MKNLCGIIFLLLCPYFFYAQNVTTEGGTTTTGTTGFLCVGANFQNTGSVNTGSLTDYAAFNMLAGAGCRYWLQSTLNGTGEAGTYAGFHVQSGNLANLFSGMELHTYLQGVWQEAATGSDLLSIMETAEADIYFKTSKPYNAVRVVFGGLVSAVGEVRIYYGFGQNTRPDAELLPVAYKQFGVKESGQGIMLYWQMATDESLEAMFVEKSRDGIHFSAAGQVAPNSAHTYSFYDPAAKGKTYYRIRTVQRSRWLYSAIQVIDVARQPLLHVVHPVQDVLKIEMRPNAIQACTIQVWSISGQCIYQMQYKGSGTCHIPLNRTRISRGVYFVKIVYGNGKTDTQRFVVS